MARLTPQEVDATVLKLFAEWEKNRGIQPIVPHRPKPQPKKTLLKKIIHRLKKI